MSHNNMRPEREATDKFVQEFESRHPNSQSNEFNPFFDDITHHYQSARPGYPAELYADLFTFVSEPEQSRVLEIGAGNGIATAEIAKSVRTVTAIEPGESLLSQARENCSHLSNIEFRLSSFEDIEEDERYDIVAAFTAFHWVRGDDKFDRAADMLKDKGVFAACWNSYMPPKGDLGSTLSSLIAKAVSPEKPAESSIDVVRKSLDKLSYREREIQDQTALAIRSVKRYITNYDYDATRYCALLNTFPNISKLDKSRKESLFSDVCELVKAKHVTIPVVTSLSIASQRASLERSLTES